MNGGTSPRHAVGRRGRPDRGDSGTPFRRPDARPLGAALVVASFIVAVTVASLLFPQAYPAPVALKGALLGTSTGLLAVGLVLTYRATRIINFSHGAMGSLPAGIAVGVHVGRDVPWALAVPIGVVLGIVIGALIERLIIRRFATAPRLVLTVATIGLAQLLGGAAIFIPSWFGLTSVQPSFPTPLSDIEINTRQVVFDGNDLLLLAVVPVLLAVLGWFLLRTDAGIAVRGMAENMDRARLLGIPVNQLSLLLWSIAGGLSALTVVLVAPNTGVRFEFATGPAILLPALAAAAVARLTSITVAFVAGVGLGVLDQLVQWNFPDRRELTFVVFLAVIMLALLVRRRPTTRAETADDSSWSLVGVAHRLPRALADLPEMRLAKVGLGVLLAGFLLVIPMAGSTAQINFATVTLVLALAALSLVILTGWGGVVSLGQFALVGVGGITAANLIADRNSDLFLILGASAVAGGLVALVIGLPALRLVGQYLAVTTLAFAVVTEQYVVKPAIHPDLLPGRFERPELWGVVDLGDERWLYLFSLVVVAVSAVLIANLRRARAGRTIAAARDNERGVAVVGINIIETRLAGFVFAGMFAGLAGALHAVTLRSVGEQSYPTSTSLLVFSMAVIGGASSIGGTLAGVALVRWLAYVFPRYQFLLAGVGVLVILMIVPGGLGQAFERVRDRYATWCARRRGVTLLDELETIEEPVGEPPQPQSASRSTVAPGPGGHPPHPPSTDATQPLLSCDGVESSYGSFQVLFGIDASVADGEVLALLGTNGAGKSTLLRSIGGLLPPGRGRITFAGNDITMMPAERVARLGLSVMPGGRGVFPTLTVAENLRLAGWMQRNNRAAAEAALGDTLELFAVLRERWNQHAGDLSGGEQQQLSLAMAFVTRPKLLCIDELSLGLAPAMVGQLIDRVKEIHSSGTAILVVEQSIDVALLLAERAVFLEKGQVRFRGATMGLLERPDVLRAVFLGEAQSPGSHISAPLAERPSRQVGLECRRLTKRFGGIQAVDEVDLIVPPGSILGLIGHNGAGKTTLFDLIAGFLAADGGRVRLNGDDITARPPHRRAVAGLGRSFQEARLFPSLTVAEVLAVALETHLANRDPLAAALRLPASTVSERAAGARVDELIELLGLGSYRDRFAGELSTGLRRIVELGTLLAHDPAVVLLDEPSAGVAQREAEALPPLLRQVQSETGCSLVIIEHDMALLSVLCDALVALDQGRVVATGPPEAVLADQRVVASYLGTDQRVADRSGLRTGGSTAP
jgi:ABC-type branched-subunit amino acid transport system ATPase component/branched-subunit amino acid ABC-type transport system permease component